MKTLEKLKEIIQSANPEIEEREIKIQNILEPYFIILDGRDNEPENETIIEISQKLNSIRLFDILWVLLKKEVEFDYEDVINRWVTPNGKDNLDSKSTETINWLYELLK